MPASNGNKGGEVVAITGASAGVGRATARLFASQGARLGLLARDPARLRDTLAEVEDLGGEGIVVAADVSDPAATEELARALEEKFGRIDVWINNAMVSVYSRIWDMPPEEFKRVTEVTYLGAVYGAQAALRRMLPRSRGTIVQVGSALAYRSIPFQSAYCASKHAIRGFLDSLRSELLAERKGIHVTMVQLPSLNTPQFEWTCNRLGQKTKPPPPIYQPEIAAEAICWAAHHDRREIQVGISTVAAILANKVAPWALDRYLAQPGHAFIPTGEPVGPDAEGNLWKPVAGDPGAHGPFDADAKPRSPQLEFVKRRNHFAWIGLGLAAAVGYARRGH
ncbi:MAG: SDR family oxidoreductase [Opitutaceae bacterium]